MTPTIDIRHGAAEDILSELAADSIDCCVTSPPYWSLRDYETEGQIGLEKSPEEWCARLVLVFRQVRRVLKPTGTLWINMGDSFIANSHGDNPAVDPLYPKGRTRTAEKILQCSKRAWGGRKPKDMVGQPWMLAFALRHDGWFLRRDIIWEKPNCMPESVRDRPTTSHEYIFLLTKSETYYYDQAAIFEPVTGTSHSRGHGVNPKAVGGWDTGPGDHSTVEFNRTEKRAGRNSRIHKDVDPAHQTPAKQLAKQNRSFSAAVNGLVSVRNARSVWRIPTAPFKGAHFATFPPRLVERCILAGSSQHGCCTVCGSPYKRTWFKKPLPRIPTTGRQERKWTEDVQRRSRKDNPHRGVVGSGVKHTLALKAIETVSWDPTCDCAVRQSDFPLLATEVGVCPSVVLDPFVGSGTTLLVAARLGRQVIGIDINASYCKMAFERLVKAGFGKVEDADTETNAGGDGTDSGPAVEDDAADGDTGSGLNGPRHQDDTGLPERITGVRSGQLQIGPPDNHSGSAADTREIDSAPD